MRLQLSGLTWKLSMRIKINRQKQSEWRTKFAWLPVWSHQEFIWLELFEYKWEADQVGYVEWYVRSVDNA